MVAEEGNTRPQRPVYGKVVQRIIEEEMKKSYIDYAMSVIVGRALPDARDGLKPVHRRVLYTMFLTGLTHNKPFRKSANVVGNCMARFHPHGDAAIYDTLVRLAQPFSMRYPLVDGQGNFGSIDGDTAAAMRYTEARLSKLSEELLADINRETVDFVPNFDNSIKEPVVLPSRLPNLLVNGSSGIAVGMATNIPPHNICEVVEAVVMQIDNPDVGVEDLMEALPGPDFPTGGIICGRRSILSLYRLGHGIIKIRAKAEVEEAKHRIIISEIPFQVNKAQMIEEIARCVYNKSIVGISDLRDESDREGMRIVMELKRDANPEVVLNQLFKHSKMEYSFGAIATALVGGTPRTLPLKEMIACFISHRRDVVRRRTAYDLKVAKERAHILEGLIIALRNIDEVIKTIRASDDVESAKNALMTGFSISELQAKAILDMRLQRLASLEQEKIRAEHKELLITIGELESILTSEQKILNIIKKELLEIKSVYGDARRTEISDVEVDEIDVEDLIEEEDMVVTISHRGYIKRLSVDTYQQQRRGGKGITAANTHEEDFIEHLFIAHTHSYLLLFTDKGNIYWLKVYQVPEASRYSAGRPIVNLIRIGSDEKITAFIPVREFADNMSLVMATRRGLIKKTRLKAYSHPRKGGIKAIVLNDSDSLINVELTDNSREIIIATGLGRAIRFHEGDVRHCGRVARGVRGIRLKPGDEVVGMVAADSDKTLLTITENGFGKRTAIEEYRLTARGGKGVRNIKIGERNGNVVSVKAVSDVDEVMVATKSGMLIRVPASGISVISRNTKGVRIMRLNQGDVVVASARYVKE
ncbi:DNA gyrase subunit A [Candidatus Woesearchaeota archaeon CG1_02_47_18]|nr:MAG: DNA gyrase subunit A [Candidatus Woesearchaeota archaeon CG1_02_47_18]